jgi:hypothetical protein
VEAYFLTIKHMPDVGYLTKPREFVCLIVTVQVTLVASSPRCSSPDRVSEMRAWTRPHAYTPIASVSITLYRYTVMGSRYGIP